MELYKKIKEFTEICPIPTNIGTYLKDASEVCNIYREMLGLEGIDNLEKARSKEKELDKRMNEILKKWVKE
jgi:hypothetical protein